jgi:hypothetical protein
MTPPPAETPLASSELLMTRVARQRAAFSHGDLLSLLVGATLAVAMLAWFSWRMVQNVARDRDVETRAAAQPHAH